MAVRAGDLVIGDADGVVVIAREKAEDLLLLAERKVAAETARLEEIARGQTASTWLTAALRASGVLQGDEVL